MAGNHSHTSRFAGGIGGAEPQAGATSPEPEAAPQAPTPAMLREAAAREALLTSAQLDFQRLGRMARNGYSEQLEQQGQRVTRYMRREHGEGSSATYVDPNQFMVGVAIGMSDSRVVSSILRQQGITPNRNTVSEVANNMRATYRFPYSVNPGQTTETHAPYAIGIDYYNAAPQTCVIVPPSAYYPAILQVPGLTREQNLDFINLHESWHCRDTRNNFIGLDRARIDSLNLHHPERAIGNPDMLRAMVIGNRQESLADVGAVAELIRRGADPSIIDNVIQWRRGMADDPTHMSVAALEDLKRTVSEMGVRDFRRMDEDRARGLYNDIAERNSPTPEVMERMIAYTTGTAEERRSMLVLQRDNPDMQRAIQFMAGYQLPEPRDPNAPAQTGPVTTPLTPQEQGIFEQVRLYDASQILQDRAFRDGGKITPETLVSAYQREQRDLMRQLDRKPGDPVIQARLEKLDESFVNTVQNLDYIAANAARGVDITRDRALQGVTLPSAEAAPAPAPAAAEPATTTPAGGNGIVARACPTMGM